MNDYETFGFPPLKEGSATHTDALAALRMLVEYAHPANEHTARMCARDIAAYIKQLEMEAAAATVETMKLFATVSRLETKLDQFFEGMEK